MKGSLADYSVSTAAKTIFSQRGCGVGGAQDTNSAAVDFGIF